MKAVFLALAFWMALLPRAGAQAGGVSVEVTVDQNQYLPNEELRVAVRIQNLSGQTLTFGDTADWLAFYVEASDNFVVEKYGDPDVRGEFVLESSTAATKRANIAPYFNLVKPGRYRVMAKVKVGQWKTEISSPTVSFDVVKGIKLQQIEFGVPSSADEAGRPPEVRKFILQQAEYSREMRLYLRLTDATESHVFKVFPISRMVSFSHPEAQLDKFSNLHVLHQIGQKSFCYCVVNPEGQIITRQTHDYSEQSRPRLKRLDNGRIEIFGGVQRVSDTDLPPPETAPSTVQPKSATDAKEPKS